MLKLAAIFAMAINIAGLFGVFGNLLAALMTQRVGAIIFHMLLIVGLGLSTYLIARYFFGFRVLKKHRRQDKV